jgi:hypothetical protein
MKPSSFSTICSSSCVNELKGFLLSLSLFHTNERIYILCDTITKQKIDEMKNENNEIKLDIIWFVELDKYTKLNRQTMERLDIWADFQMSKSIVIERALEREKDTLFLDCDIIILHKIDDIQEGYDIGVSPGFVNKEIEDKYGKYNGGMLWVKNKQVPDKWREFTKTSRYYDQASIEDLVASFKSFEFGDNYNLQTWRFIVGEEHATKLLSYIISKNGYILYKNKPLKFIHTHFNTTHFKNINDYFKKIIKDSNMKNVLKCIEVVEKN